MFGCGENAILRWRRMIAPPPPYGICPLWKKNTFQKGASLIPWKGPWWLGRKDRQVSISKSICLSPISSCNSRAGLQEETPRAMWCWKYGVCKYRLIIDPWKLLKFFTFPRYNLVFQSDNIYSHRPQSRRWRPTKSTGEFYWIVPLDRKHFKIELTYIWSDIPIARYDTTQECL